MKEVSPDVDSGEVDQLRCLVLWLVRLYGDSHLRFLWLLALDQLQ